MTRVLICCALQIAFVTAYGMWALLRPEAAFGWMVPFVVVVLALVLYNREPWRKARR